MTKRPTTGRSRLMGVGSLASWLRDRRIGIKLGFIMFVPTLATVIVGANGLVNQISNAGVADQARTLATLSADAGTLVDSLQDERAYAVESLGYAANANKAPKSNAPALRNDALTNFQQQVVRSRAANDEYGQQAAVASDVPGTLQNTLKGARDGLEGLETLRSQVNGVKPKPGLSSPPPPLDTSTAAKQYSNVISTLLAIRDSAAQLAGDPALSFEMRAAGAIAEEKEFISQEREVGLEELISGANTSLFQRFTTALTGQTLQDAAFGVVASPAEQNVYRQIITGDSIQPSQATINIFQNAGLGRGSLEGITVKQWDATMASRSNLYRNVEKTLDNEVVGHATSIRDNVERQIIIDVGLLFAIVLLAMLIAWFVARSMARSLRELKHGALTVARQGLPQAVARLRDPSLATQMSPEQIALQIAEPLPVRSHDEFGEVTEAFNAVHIEAVRTAAEQAVLRSSVATMFVNLARRSQILVDRLIGHLDRLERGEEDPDRLAELFQLDHLATRMRRNDENLLVLAGADSTRVQREPAPLVDVLRAAQSEVEHYTRVEFGIIDRDLEVGSHAVNDLVHLVAELLDNATAFSPPDSPVQIEARRFGDRAVLYVEDRGIGISADQLAELNDRLAKPPLVDVAVSRMMGLVVVARLAARHGIEVKLRPGPDRGTVADVLLPSSVLVSHTTAFRTPSVGGAERGALASSEPAPRQPRSPFGPPLALESGPSANEPMHAGAGSQSAYMSQPTSGAPGDFGGFAASAERFGTNRPALLGPGSTGRALPSWSDLTGAVGSGPAGGFGPYDQGPYNGGYGNGRNGGSSDAYHGANGTNGHGRPGSGTGLPTSPLPRRAPQPVDDPRSASGPPLGSGFERGGYGDGPFDSPDGRLDRPRVPRQRPHGLDRSNDAGMMDDFADAEVVDDGRSNRPPVDADDAVVTRFDDRPSPSSAPPAWPPVAQSQQPATDDAGQFRPHAGRVESFDRTTEIPRFRDLDLAGAVRPERGPSAAAMPPADDLRGPTADDAGRPRPDGSRQGQQSRPQVMPFADETMELPIFRELENAWFASSGSSGESIMGQRQTGMAPVEAMARPPASAEPARGTVAAAEQRPAEVRAPQPRQAPPAQTSRRPDYYPDATVGSQMAGAANSAGRDAERDWHSSADEGWVAAAAASQPADGGTTPGGLPRRVPLAQLVPGGVERGMPGTNRRSPDAVRGLLSAYHRGVQRGRQQTTDDSNASPESTNGRSTPGGKEQDS